MERPINISSVLQKHYMGLEYSLSGDPVNEAEFNANFIVHKTNGIETPTWDKLQNYLTEMKRLQSEYDLKKYQRQREVEYPSIQECVHAILDDELEALQIKRQVVKDKFPKE